MHLRSPGAPSPLAIEGLFSIAQGHNIIAMDGAGSNSKRSPPRGAGTTFLSNRHPALSFCLSMNLRRQNALRGFVREGKTGIHPRIKSEGMLFFRIMLYSDRGPGGPHNLKLEKKIVAIRTERATP